MHKERTLQHDTTPKPRRAAIYARVSTHEQEDNNSIPDQLRECREYAGRETIEVVAEYTDVESGTKSSRKELNRLLGAAERREFDVVIAKKIDRFARGHSGYQEPFQRLRAAGVAVIYATESVPENFIDLMVAIGGMEARAIAERTRAGRRQKVRDGRVNPPRLRPCMGTHMTRKRKLTYYAMKRHAS
jgi:site-specific DNA recombinase